jgi:hypothetical protein
VTYTLKRVWADGTSAITMDPLSFLARLAALVPPPYFNLTRYHGVLAPNSHLRSRIVPHPTHAPRPLPEQLTLPGLSFSQLGISGSPPPRFLADKRPGHITPGRHPWAYLLRRSFSHDVTVCPACQGPLRLQQLCTRPSEIARALAREGLGPMPPPPPARPARGQLTLGV